MTDHVGILIFNASNRETSFFIPAATETTQEIVVQHTIPCVQIVELSCGLKINKITDTFINAIEAAVTARQTCKPVFIAGTNIGGEPMGSFSFLHVAASKRITTKMID